MVVFQKTIELNLSQVFTQFAFNEYDQFTPVTFDYFTLFETFPQIIIIAKHTHTDTEFISTQL